jgi:hypothetical protein
MIYKLKQTFELSDNQTNLIVIYLVSFLVSTMCMYYLTPDKFNWKWGIVCFILAFLYNIAYYKFFSD